MPMNPDPTPEGNVWIVGVDGGERVIGVAKNPAEVPASEALRYASHYATCPQAREWRRP